MKTDEFNEFMALKVVGFVKNSRRECLCAHKMLTRFKLTEEPGVVTKKVVKFHGCYGNTHKLELSFEIISIFECKTSNFENFKF